MVLKTDASDVGAGMALYAKRDNCLMPICFHSSKWNDTIKKYSVGEKEALALVYAFQRWSKLLDRPHKKLAVYTDHLPNLGKLQKVRDDPSPRGKRINRWFNLLSNFTFELGHVPGENMGDADFLSRYPSDGDNVLENVIIKKINWEFPVWKSLNYDEKLELCLNLHKNLAHVGYDRLTKFIRKRTNEHVSNDLAIKAINKCTGCQRNKPQNLDKIPEVEIPKKFLDKVHVDLFSWKNHGENMTILTAQDSFTKFGWATVVNSKLSEIILEAMKKMFLPFGIPKIIVADQGKEFKNKSVISFFSGIGTKMHFTTVARHEANGQVERFNRTIKDWAKKCLAGEEVLQLWNLMLSYNTTTNSSTGFSPYELVLKTDDSEFLFQVAHEQSMSLLKRKTVMDFIR